MKRRLSCRLLSDHGSEIVLLGMIAVGVILLLWRGLERGLVESGLDVAAFLLILQRIVEAVQKRWEQRSVDRMTEMTGQSIPTGAGPIPTTIVNPPETPVPVEEQ